MTEYLIETPWDSKDKRDLTERFAGLRIVNVEFPKDADDIFLTFEDGIRIKIWDNGQSCCEHRYTRTDDDPSDLIGKVFTSAIVKDGPDLTSEDDPGGGPHDSQFLEIIAGGTCVTFCTHNEHNGYYGGFSINYLEMPKV